MSLGEVWWFLDPQQTTDAADVFAALERRGLPLRHPGTGQLTLLDDEPSQQPGTAEALRRWTSDTPLTTKLWLTPDTDVLLTAEPGLVTFDLDGLTPAEAETTVLAALAVAALTAATIALIADSHLPDTGELWRRYVTGDRDQPAPTADLTLYRAQNADSYTLSILDNSWLRQNQ